MLTKIGLLIVTAVGGGTLVGALLFLSSKVIYLIIMSPLIAMIVAGFLLMAAVERGNIPWKSAVIITGLLMGFVTYSAYRYGEYLDFLRISRNDILDESPGLSSYTIDNIIEMYLMDEVNDTGLIGFIKLQAKEGMTISSTRDYSDTGNDIGSGATIIYWVVELLILMGGTALMGYSRTHEYFCHETGLWLRTTDCGVINAEDFKVFMSHFQKGQFQQAARLVQRGYSTSTPGVHLLTGKCEPDSPEGMVQLVGINRKGNRNLILMTALPDASYQELIGNIGRT